MSTPLDMSLHEMIKSSRGSGNRDRVRERGRTRRGRGPRGFFSGGRMTGPVRRNPLAVNAQPSPYTIAKASSKLLMFYDMICIKKTQILETQIRRGL